MRKRHFLVTFITPSDWERFVGQGSWWWGFERGSGWFYVRFLGVEVSVT